MAGTILVKGRFLGPANRKTKKNFKQCPSCGYVWHKREDFLEDPSVRIIGYQVNFSELELGFMLFNHDTCKTTMALAVSAFRDLYAGPVFAERLTDSNPCPGYCMKQYMLEPCPARCECAYVRTLLQTIRTWGKSEISPKH